MQVQGYETMLVQPALQSIAVGAMQLQQLQIRMPLSDDLHVIRVKHLVGQASELTMPPAVEWSLLPATDLLCQLTLRMCLFPCRCAGMCKTATTLPRSFGRLLHRRANWSV